MTKSITPSPSQAASLGVLLDSVGVTKSSVIRVTGPGALPALLWLCRRGYDQVGYVRADDGAPYEELHEEPDAIIAAQTCGEIELKRLLAVGRQVRPGGFFIFQLRAGPDALGVDWLLERNGFVAERRVTAGRRTLFVTRRRAPSLRKAA
ncbi:MAG: hypothetical protein JSR98_06700 [Proteobacteria bacterium]|nr:hypothetical protein [Pseudomonadota bacterium]